jgi:hypothetical protein
MGIGLVVSQVHVQWWASVGLFGVLNLRFSCKSCVVSVMSAALCGICAV